MDRAMLEVTLSDPIRNEGIHIRTRVNGIAQRVAKQNWQWAAHSTENQRKYESKGAGIEPVNTALDL
ncbi:jg9727 [Pararge aegeria aegeria]|uniref:Jg9727 protein n=1 Tax=Pararge aegeria aegeria TaxID=348720 RepID=A0A8S4SQM0_9NEOP|nr:jg9727 [Pararge aegeria aegeria]